MTVRSLAALFAALLICAAPALADDGPKGVAFAQAAEQATGMCMGGNPEKTLACAREKCVAGGAPAHECSRVAWCYPMGWTADVFLQHTEGPHWHEYLCGWDSRETLELAIKAKCDRSVRGYLIECAAVTFWDPDGNELKAN